jgi:hypothetical protein
VASIPNSQVRKGMVIVETGQLYYVVDRDLNTPGNWRAHLKPTMCDTGLKVTVPPFVGVGEIIPVDTRTGDYLSRAK